MAHSDPYRRKRGSHRSRSLLRRVGPPVLVLGIAAALDATTISAQAASQGACPAPVCITVGGHKDGYVGTGFAGFSYEKDRIGAGVFDPADTNLVNLFRLLGPSVLRVGGNLNDR
ncbi:MAG TPA: hypothetical protein VJO72_13095, partial [Candidatus Dormibacteraeota bacterium]|nr:hypothetical protein [Candidatus Dormibacteraeota bacterium]